MEQIKGPVFKVGDKVRTPEGHIATVHCARIIDPSTHGVNSLAPYQRVHLSYDIIPKEWHDTEGASMHFQPV